MGFVLARLHYIDFNVWCNPETPKAPIGECYWYRQSFYKAGIIMHLACILPASFLAVFQFIPSIRHAFIIYHRISGTLIILLCLVSNAAAIMIARHAFGGEVAGHAVTGTAVLLSTFGLLSAYYNIKRLQIDQHRAWIMRSFAWMTHVITERLIILPAITVLGNFPYDFWSTRSCAEMATVAGPDFLAELHPECGPGYPNSSNPGYFTVRADIAGDIFQYAAAVAATFPMAAWLALLLHSAVVEFYLTSTTNESERLRQVSYERQLARGFRNPGSSGFFLSRYGDEKPFIPKIESESQKSEEAKEDGDRTEKKTTENSTQSSA